MLSHYLDLRYAARLLQEVAERAGYLLKDRVSEVVVVADALRRIAEGECVIDPTIVSRRVTRKRARGPRLPALRLTGGALNGAASDRAGVT